MKKSRTKAVDDRVSLAATAPASLYDRVAVDPHEETSCFDIDDIGPHTNSALREVFSDEDDS